jgi:hypothetical protein
MGIREKSTLCLPETRTVFDESVYAGFESDLAGHWHHRYERAA